MFSEAYLNKLSREHNFIARIRKLSPLDFVKALIFSNESHGKLTLLDLKNDILGSFGCQISQEAIHKKFTPGAVGFLKALLLELIAKQLPPMAGVAAPHQFTAINIKDSTKITLPLGFHGAFPGYGSFNKKSSIMNIQYECNLLARNWKSFEITTVAKNDQQDSKETVGQIQPGSLNLRDLGYITTSYLKAVKESKAFFLNRLPKIGAYHLNNGQLEQVDWERVDKEMKANGLEHKEMEVYLGKKEKIKCRMVIAPVPEKVKGERIRKAAQGGRRKKGYQLKKEYKIKAGYNIYITNVPRGLLSTWQICQAYRLRWQVELIFKMWKSNLGLGHIKPMKLERMLCQLYAKLIWILLNNNLFILANRILQKECPNKNCSTSKFFKCAKRFSHELRWIVGNTQQLSKWFIERVAPLIPNIITEKRLKQPTHGQLLYDLFLN